MKGHSLSRISCCPSQRHYQSGGGHGRRCLRGSRTAGLATEFRSGPAATSNPTSSLRVRPPSGRITDSFPSVSWDSQAQDLKYRGEEAFLTIGSDNVFREYVNINRGTAGGSGHTKIGDHCYFMVNAHVAHDCILGDHVMMANAATLGGHVVIEDYGTVGAFSGVHPFCRIGAHGWIGGYSVVTKDVLPYSKTVDSPRHEILWRQYARAGTSRFFARADSEHQESISVPVAVQAQHVSGSPGNSGGGPRSRSADDRRIHREVAPWNHQVDSA